MTTDLNWTCFKSFENYLWLADSGLFFVFVSSPHHRIDVLPGSECILFALREHICHFLSLQHHFPSHLVIGCGIKWNKYKSGCLGRSLGRHALVGPLCESHLTMPPLRVEPSASQRLKTAEDTDVMHHYPMTEINDECWHCLLSPHWQTQSWLLPSLSQPVFYLLSSLSLPLPAALAFLGLHQHCFQFLNWDGQRHKEISWLSKKRGRLKMHAGAFCH